MRTINETFVTQPEWICLGFYVLSLECLPSVGDCDLGHENEDEMKSTPVSLLELDRLKITAYYYPEKF